MTKVKAPDNPHQPNLPPLRNRTLAQSWIALPARTRLFVSVGACIVGATGLMVSDYLEKVAPPVKTTSTSLQDHS